MGGYRARLAAFLSTIGMEITFMVITILYGILVLFDFLAGEETTAGIRKHAAGPLY